MRVFVTVVDAGSLSAAADKLDLSRPVVTRYVAELEQWTGARLLHRTTRRLSLTAAGEELLPRCRQVLELAGDMQEAVRQPAEAPRGQLRITASTSFAQAQLADAVADYVRLYPGVAVDLVLLDRAVNLVDERIDLAIRVAVEIDPNLIARRLTDCRSVVCASPGYLKEQGGRCAWRSWPSATASRTRTSGAASGISRARKTARPFRWPWAATCRPTMPRA